jgi:uncharacterized membrane protein YdjX (TVP38/TMEM64 family)/rhodanese-related sulfurtransferase
MKHKIARGSFIALLLVGIILVVVYRDQLDAQALQSWVQELGFAAPLVFMLIYALGTVFFFPGSVLTLAGGALFGPVMGTLINLTGATIGAALAFLLARYLASDWVEEKTGGRLKQLKEGVEGEGWRFVAFVRLMPLFPFNLLNYALGLTRIPLLQYVVASWLFMLPGAIAYTYLGYAGRETVAGGEGLVQKIMLALALLAILAFTPRLVARLRRGPMLSIEELYQRLQAEGAPLLLDVRSPEEYAGELGHIQGARNIPLNDLPDQLDGLLDYMEQPVALICRTDRRSASAARILASKGFADLHIVRGGMMEWNQKGLPVV